VDDINVVSDSITTATAPQTQGERSICGFWSRILALLIDLIILRLAGVIIGALLGGVFIVLGNNARLVGLAVITMYFGVTQSCLGGGQSLGQRIMGIRVVDAEGRLISSERAAMRAVILFTPLLLNKLVLPITSVTGMTLGLVSFIIGGGLIYFYIFNFATRQSLHDLVLGTFVVRADSNGAVAPRRTSRVHYYVFGAVVILALLATIPLRFLITSGPLKDTYSLLTHLDKVKGGTVSSVMRGVFFGPSGEERYLAVTAEADSPYSVLLVADGLRKAIVHHYAILDRVDMVVINVRCGYNIGIHQSHEVYVWRNSPHELQSGIGASITTHEASLF
jgi:uncharacterized RDD family membrane protein YckC